MRVTCMGVHTGQRPRVACMLRLEVDARGIGFEVLGLRQVPEVQDVR
jgi:hypothetical protein